MSLNDTPRSSRLHIGIFGHVNSGKTSLLNALTNQEVGVVSNIEGTTTDPIYKAMELHGVGPVVFIDTAGFGDVTTLGKQRLEKTEETITKTDIALLVLSQDDLASANGIIKKFEDNKVPYIVVLNKIDESDVEELVVQIEAKIKQPYILTSATKQIGLNELKDAIISKLPQDYEMESITGFLVKEDDVVVLVMPQDIQAPKGRLILPQVQTIRDLLDQKCSVVSCTTDKFETTLKQLKHEPNLIICDSQVFPFVYEKKPATSKLTSFSVLFAQYKGDIASFVDGANAIETLKESSSVLIAEACTHAPLSEDIGRVKIPAMLKKRIGKNLQIDIVSGADFPKDVSSYDLIIHCGACMFNRKFVLSRMEQAKKAGVPITNYGITIAYLSNILDKISY